MKVDLARRLHADPLVVIRYRVRRLEPCHDQIEVRPRLFEGDAGFQAPFHEQPSVAASIQASRSRGRLGHVVHAHRLDLHRRRNGNPQIRREDRRHAAEPSRRDADDRVLIAAELQRAADDRRAGAELASPVLIRNHRHPGRRRRIVLGHERAADRSADAEHAEVVAGDDLAEGQSRAVPEVQRTEHRRVADDLLEHLVLRVEIEIVGVRRGAEALAGGDGRRVCVDVDEPIGPLDGQRPEQHRVDYGKEGRIEADADREGGDGDRREPRALDQPAQRKTNV